MSFNNDFYCAACDTTVASAITHQAEHRYACTLCRENMGVSLLCLSCYAPHNKCRVVSCVFPTYASGYCKVIHNDLNNLEYLVQAYKQDFTLSARCMEYTLRCTLIKATGVNETHVYHRDRLAKFLIRFCQRRMIGITVTTDRATLDYEPCSVVSWYNSQLECYFRLD